MRWPPSPWRSGAGSARNPSLCPAAAAALLLLAAAAGGCAGKDSSGGPPPTAATASAIAAATAPVPAPTTTFSPPSSTAPSPASQLGPTAAATAETPRCGVERWDVKTLSDAGAGSVNFTPQPTTVNALRALPAPVVGDSTPRMAGVETTTYTVRAALVEMKLADDKDIHLVIADPADPSHTMIAEFPDVGCAGAVNSAKKGQMQAARAALVSACGSASSSSFRILTGLATITGVGFFDQIHGQVGVAPNGIELHPVLHFESSDCRRATPSPTPSSVH